MHKNLLITIAAIVGAIVSLTGCSDKTNSARQIKPPPQTSGGFDTLLDKLVVPIPEGRLSEADRQAIAKKHKEQHQAETKLRELGTNVLPQLMKKVQAVGRVEATNRAAARPDTQRLARAFEILGAKARPLLPMLTNELHSGRSIGPSMAGLIGIGGTEAGLALIPELTNSDPTIQSWAMSAVSYFDTNSQVVAAAAPLVLNHLHDDSASSRALAADILGNFQVNAETVLPALAQLAEHDQDVVVRITAIKAIGSFGTNAASEEATLKKIATTAQEKSVRRVCYQALQAVHGRASSDTRE